MIQYSVCLDIFAFTVNVQTTLADRSRGLKVYAMMLDVLQFQLRQQGHMVQH